MLPTRRMVKTRRSGFTILELLVGLFVVFGSVCTLAVVMVSTTRFFHHIHERSLALQLARENMTQAQLHGAANQCLNWPGYANSGNYLWSFPSFDPIFDGEMGTALQSITTPSGVQLEFELGLRHLPMTGCCVSDAGMVAYGIGLAGRAVRLYNDQAGTGQGDYPQMPYLAAPGGGTYQDLVYSLSCTPTFSQMLVGATEGTYVINDPANIPGSWGGSYGFHGTGVALNPATGFTTTLGTDNYDHQMWEAGIPTSTNLAQSVPLPPCQPLQDPEQVAVDPVTNNIWFSDQLLMCLRTCTQTLAWTDIATYKPPLPAHMGTPHGLAFTYKDQMLVVDATAIWIFTPPFSGGSLHGTSFTLPQPLVGQVTSIGAAHNPYGGLNYAYMSDTQDELWRFTVPNGPVVKVH